MNDMNDLIRSKEKELQVDILGQNRFEVTERQANEIIAKYIEFEPDENLDLDVSIFFINTEATNGKTIKFGNITVNWLEAICDIFDSQGEIEALSTNTTPLTDKIFIVMSLLFKLGKLITVKVDEGYCEVVAELYRKEAYKGKYIDISTLRKDILDVDSRLDVLYKLKSIDIIDDKVTLCERVIFDWM